MNDDDDERRVKEAFRAGRRAGIWLALNGPRARAQRRRIDVGAMRGQDRAMEGMGDVFARAEQERDAPPPRPRPAPVPAPAPAPRPAPPAPRPAPPAPPASEVFAPPALRSEEVPELPLSEYAPDGYNEYTTQQLRDRLELLRRQEKDSEVRRLMEVIRKRKAQDILAMKRAIRVRERQEREAAMDPRERARLARVRGRQEQDRQESQAYEQERARLSINIRDRAQRDRLDREWRQRQMGRIGI